MTRSTSPRIVMLVAEDNPADVCFFKEAIEASRTSADVYVVDNGADVMCFLCRRSPYESAPRPDVIVLDLNLPLKSGAEVLEEMASDPLLSTMPVAVLTSSTTERIVCSIYPAGRCLYFTKTDEFNELQNIVRKIATHARNRARIQNPS